MSHFQKWYRHAGAQVFLNFTPSSILSSLFDLAHDVLVPHLGIIIFHWFKSHKSTEVCRFGLSGISFMRAETWPLFLSVYMRLHLKTTERWKLVQNAAAHLLSGATYWKYMTFVVTGLHWMLLGLWVEFKVLIMTCKSPEWAGTNPPKELPFFLGHTATIVVSRGTWAGSTSL